MAVSGYRMPGALPAQFSVSDSTKWCLLNKSFTDCSSYCSFYIFYLFSGTYWHLPSPTETHNVPWIEYGWHGKLSYGRIMVSRQVQITNMKINKQQPVSTNYNVSYFSHAARHSTGLLHGLTGYTTGMQQRVQCNPQLRNCVKQSPDRQPDMSPTKWTRWKLEPAPTTGLAALVVYILQTYTLMRRHYID